MIFNLLKIKDKFLTLPTIQMKLFWGVSIVVAVVGFFCSVLTFAEHNGFIPTLGAFTSCLAPVIIMIVCSKTKKYEDCYNALAIVVSCFIVPITYFTNGGMHSGTPLVCLVSIAIPSFCFKRSHRRIITALAIIIQGIVLGFETFKIDLIKVTPLPNSIAIEADIVICYIVSAIALSFMVDILLEEYKDYSKSKEILNKYMDVGLQNQIYDSYDLADATGRKSNVTVLFADISSFTSISEGMTPEEVAQFLNSFLSVADKAIHDNLGVIDKYMGDCVMAYWIDSGQTGGGVIEACKAVTQMRQELHNMAEDTFRRFGCELDFAAGINYGEVIIGGIGSENRKDFTIIGDAVNTAQRLQSSAARGTTYVSKTVADILGDNAELEMIEEKMMLKGKAVPVEVFSLKSIEKKRIMSEQIEFEERIRWKSTQTGYMFHICGCRGSYAVSGDIYSEFGGETSCYIIKKDKYAIVVDCGTGFYKARDILKDCEKIDVLLTHVHYDHILGLLDWSIFPENADIKFYGDFDHWEGKNTINNLLRAPYWPINLSGGQIIDIEKKRLYKLSNETDVTFYDSYHPNNCSILIIHVAGRKICIMSDCEDHNIIPDELVKESDILVYDAMYENKDFPARKGWGHSTWEEAVSYASIVKPGILLITHHDPRNSDKTLRAHEGLAKLTYPQTLFARQGSKISL